MFDAAGERTDLVGGFLEAFFDVGNGRLLPGGLVGHLGEAAPAGFHERLDLAQVGREVADLPPVALDDLLEFPDARAMKPDLVLPGGDGRADFAEAGVGAANLAVEFHEFRFEAALLLLQGCQGAGFAGPHVPQVPEG